MGEGNAYIRVLRSQLEQYIADELGQEYLAEHKNKTELWKIKKAISEIKELLEKLETRKAELEESLKK